MNWKKIYKDERLPNDDIIYTDGKTLSVRGKDIYNKSVYIGHNKSIDQATHYMLLREISLPHQKCEAKCIRCKN